MNVLARVIILAAISLSTARADDWPCYRGANADAISREPGLLTEWPADGLKKLWSAELGDGGGGTFGGAAIEPGLRSRPPRR